MKKNKNRCPSCNKKITDFEVKFSPASVYCANCNEQIPPEMIFTKSSVNHLQYMIPKAQRDDFMNQIGFERKSVRRSSKLAVIFLIALMTTPLLMTAVFADGRNRIYAILGLACLTLSILGYYRDETKTQYQKKKD